jgi:hypothetical protein
MPPDQRTAEEVIAAQLERRLSSLPLGTRLGLMLEQNVYDGVRWRARPHVAGWLARLAPDGMVIRLLSTAAGTTARALLEEELLDVVSSRDHPPTVRLT